MLSSSRNQRPQLNCNHPHYFTPPIANLGHTNLHLHSFTFICTHLHLHKPHIHAPIMETLMPNFGLFLALYTITLIFYFQSSPKPCLAYFFRVPPNPCLANPSNQTFLFGISTLGVFMGIIPYCIVYL